MTEELGTTPFLDTLFIFFVLVCFYIVYFRFLSTSVQYFEVVQVSMH